MIITTYSKNPTDFGCEAQPRIIHTVKEGSNSGVSRHRLGFEIMNIKGEKSHGMNV